MSKNGPKILLTIDDSPSKTFREKVEFLDQNEIPAIFFCIGENIEKYFEDVVFAIEKGYLIANHSYTHPRFSSINMARVADEILKTEDSIERAYKTAGIERPYKLFRFPFGDKGNNPRFNIFQRNLPFIQSVLTNKAGRHKVQIQAFLKKNGFTNPYQHYISDEFYREMGFSNDADIYWNFDFLEYRYKNLEKVFEVMVTPYTKYDIYGKYFFEMESILHTNQDKIALIHDQDDTSDIFQESLKYCLKKGCIFTGY